MIPFSMQLLEIYVNFFRKFKDPLIKHVCEIGSEINQEIVNYFLSILTVIA